MDVYADETILKSYVVNLGLAPTGDIQSNAVDGFYHQNWQIRAKRVECPLAITKVTGCRLAPQTQFGR